MKAGTAEAAVAAVATALFCWLAFATLGGSLTDVDALVRADVHGWASPGLTSCAEALTWLGTSGVLALFGGVTIAILFRAGRRGEIRLLLIVMAGAVVLENGLKYAIQRPRPPPFFGTDPTTFSFPSGHALFSLCFYGALAVVLVRTGVSRAVAWPPVLILVAAIGSTRIYLGVHYPTDVLAGYLVATAWLAAVLAAVARNASDRGGRI